MTGHITSVEDAVDTDWNQPKRKPMHASGSQAIRNLLECGAVECARNVSKIDQFGSPQREW